MAAMIFFGNRFRIPASGDVRQDHSPERVRDEMMRAHRHSTTTMTSFEDISFIDCLLQTNAVPLTRRGRILCR